VSRESGPSSAPGRPRLLDGPSGRWLLGIIGVVALLRGLFWVAVTEVPNPVDEIYHFAYVESIATGRGIPKVGTAVLEQPTLELMRESPTFGYRRHALDPARPEQWGAAAFQYEGVQPPLYYLVVAPAYHAGRPWGITGSLYAVRIASVLLALAAIPLAWMLARELFPEHPQVWAFSALVPALLQGLNANLASVTNDALVMPLGAASALAIARSMREPRWRSAGWCGLVIGMAMLAKLNAVALIPVLALALVLLPSAGGASLWWRLRWGALTGAVAGAIASLWFLWNLFAYGRLNGASEETARLIAPLQISYPLNLEGIWSHVRHARGGLWQFERFSPTAEGHYGRVFLLAMCVAAAGTLLMLVRSRRRDLAARLSWLALCWPVTLASMVTIVYVAYTSTVVGRHSYPAVIPLLVFVAAGILLGFARPAGPVLLGLVVGAALWMEQGEIRRYVHSVYLEHVWEEGLAPVWEQPFNDGFVAAAGVTVQSDCPVVWLGLGIHGEPPDQLAVAAGDRLRSATLLGEREGIVLYHLDEPHARQFDVRFDQPLAVGAAGRGSGQVRFIDETDGRLPMAQIQCRTGDGHDTRFRQRFEPFHWDAISYRTTVLWGRLWAAAGGLLAVTVLASEARWWLSKRQNRRSRDSLP